MAFNVADWICPVCKRSPCVTIELTCPACHEKVKETFNVDFSPTGAADADHEAHLAAEHRAGKDHFRYLESGFGEFRWYLPEFLKDHIQKHEIRAFRKGAGSRDQEISKRIDDFNKKATVILAGLTKEISLQHQQECQHGSERHWLTGESGRTNLLCMDCFKVLEVKFVGTSTQHGESTGLKIATEK